ESISRSWKAKSKPTFRKWTLTYERSARTLLPRSAVVDERRHHRDREAVPRDASLLLRRQHQGWIGQAENGEAEGGRQDRCEAEHQPRRPAMNSSFDSDGLQF